MRPAIPEGPGWTTGIRSGPPRGSPAQRSAFSCSVALPKVVALGVTQDLERTGVPHAPYAASHAQPPSNTCLLLTRQPGSRDPQLPLHLGGWSRRPRALHRPCALAGPPSATTRPWCFSPGTDATCCPGYCPNQGMWVVAAPFHPSPSHHKPPTSPRCTVTETPLQGADNKADSSEIRAGNASCARVARPSVGTD